MQVDDVSFMASVVIMSIPAFVYVTIEAVERRAEIHRKYVRHLGTERMLSRCDDGVTRPVIVEHYGGVPDALIDLIVRQKVHPLYPYYRQRSAAIPPDGREVSITYWPSWSFPKSSEDVDRLVKQTSIKLARSAASASDDTANGHVLAEGIAGRPVVYKETEAKYYTDTGVLVPSGSVLFWVASFPPANLTLPCVYDRHVHGWRPRWELRIIKYLCGGIEIRFPEDRDGIV